MAHRLVGFALLLATTALACRDAPVSSPSLLPGPGVNATVRFLNLEGGCWTITPDERTHYLPLNLPAEFKRDGLPVRVDFVRRDDYGSICQVGPVIQIRAIETR